MREKTILIISKSLIASLSRAFSPPLSYEWACPPGVHHMPIATSIVLAGNVAIERAGGDAMPFCSGRVDLAETEADTNDGGASNLHPVVNGSAIQHPEVWQIEAMERLGLSAKEYTALVGGLRSLGAMFAPLGGDFDDRKLIPSWGMGIDNSFFRILTAGAPAQWAEVSDAGGSGETIVQRSK